MIIPRQKRLLKPVRWLQGLLFLICISALPAAAATISGHVTNDSGTPIEGVCVNANSEPCGRGWAGGTKTDASGAYTIDNLTDGNYYIITDTSCGGTISSFYIDQLWENVTWADDCNQSTPVTTGRTDINFALSLGGRITGTLYESDGTTPIDGNTEQIEVWLQQGDDPCNTNWAGSGFIKPDGTYSIEGVEAGTYYLMTSPFNTLYIREFWGESASVRDCSQAETVTVTAGQSYGGKDFQLEVGGSISGTLYESDGTTPIDGTSNDIQIMAMAGSDPCNLQWVHSGFLNSDGTYIIEGLEQGSYYLQTYTADTRYLPEYWATPTSVEDCSQAQTVTVTTGQDNGNKDFQLEEGQTISGTVTDSNGNPIPGVCVDANTDPCGGGSGRGSSTDTNGHYSITLPAGNSYYISTDIGCADPGYAQYTDEIWEDLPKADGCSDNSQATAVTPGASGSDSINFSLAQGGSITGTVFESDGTTPVDGTIHNIEIFVQSGSDPCNTSGVKSGRIDQDGTYQINGIPEGDYYLEAGYDSDYVPEYWASGASNPDCSRAETVTVTAGATAANKDFQLEQGATITGTLIDSATNNPIDGDANYIEILIRAEKCGSDFIDYAHLEADGSYTLKSISPGTYYLYTSSGSSPYISESWKDGGSVRDCNDSDPITVGSGETFTADFKLEQGVSISGTLFQGDTTNPITNADINIFAYTVTGTDGCDWQSDVASVAVNPDGSYTIGGLEPDTPYYLRTWSGSTNYLEEYWADPASVIDCADAQAITLPPGTNETGKDFHLNEAIVVEGTLYASDGQTPLSGDLVVNVYSGDCTQPEHVTDSDIDQDGKYHITVAEPGDYYLKAEMLFGSTENYIPEYWKEGGSVRDCASATKLTLEAGSTYSGKDFQLEEGGSISGTVFEADGTNPLTGTNICIDVYRNDPCDNTWDRAGGSCIDTANGTYTISGLDSGTYYLYSDVHDGSNYVGEWWADPTSDWQCENAQQVTVKAGETTQDIDFQLAPGGTISGTLLDETTGQPISGQTTMRVQIYGGSSACDDKYLAEEEVDAKGEYSFTNVPDGSFYLKTKTGNSYIDEWLNTTGGDLLCEGAEAVTVTGGSDVPGQDFSLVTGYTISGHVYETDGTTPIDNQGRFLRVQVLQGDCDNLTWIASTGVSETDGSFQTPALPDGTYYLRFKEAGDDESDDLHQREWWADPLSVPRCPGAGTIEIIGADVADKDFQIDLKKKFPWDLLLPAIISNKNTLRRR